MLNLTNEKGDINFKKLKECLTFKIKKNVNEEILSIDIVKNQYKLQLETPVY